MADPNDKFYLDINNYNASDYQDVYLSKLYALCLANPKVYFEARRRCIEVVRRDAIKNIYQEMFSLLTKGKNINGVHIFNNVAGINTAEYVPNFPSNETSRICVSISESLKECIDDIIEKLIPSKFNTLLGDKLSSQGKSELL